MLDETKDNLNSENLEEEKSKIEQSSELTVENAETDQASEEENATDEITVENDEEHVTSEKEETIDKKEEVEDDKIVNSDDKDEKDDEDGDDDEGEEVDDEHEEHDQFNDLSPEELVKEFQKLLKSDSIPRIRNRVEKLKSAFNQKFKEQLKEKKKAFIEEGGNELDFHYSDPVKSTFNDLQFEYKTKRQLYYKRIEEEQKENLVKRLALIEELKDLIDNAEPATMYNQFKELQEKWRSVGKIPRAKYNDTWRTYHHHVERFYDLLHLSNDFRDLDFKHNLEEKLKLVEKAEALAESDDLPKAFKELQVLHRMWKEDIGPVAREHRENVWERFSTATKKIHEKRHELQKQLDEKYEDNVVKKRDVIEKISTLIGEETISSHKIWQQKIRELESLRKEFFDIGRVPRAVNEKIWREFKDATRSFNRVKNAFYKNIKHDQQENLKKKNALVEKAEELKDSEDWDTTTEIMKQIQAEWKTIGHVPRKYSDKIWKRFKDACNHYFDRLHGVQDEANKDQIEAFTKKKEILENLKSQAAGNETLSLDVINAYVEDWRNLGSLPRNMRHIESKFNKTLQTLYAKLDLDDKEIAMLKFRNIVDGYLASRNFRKVDNEQLFVRKKIDEITREIQQLENNISFISNADDDNPILKNVHDQIDNYNNQLEIWKTKLDYLVNLEY